MTRALLMVFFSLALAACGDDDEPVGGDADGDVPAATDSTAAKPTSIYLKLGPPEGESTAPPTSVYRNGPVTPLPIPCVPTIYVRCP